MKLAEQLDALEKHDYDRLIDYAREHPLQPRIVVEMLYQLRAQQQEAHISQ